MIRDAKFWVLMAVFQVLFGLAVFAMTRDYYVSGTSNVTAHPLTTNQSAPVWPDGITESNIARLSGAAVNTPISQDPFEISRQAEQLFASKQYARAAEAYERLLEFSPDDAEIYNNLGLTLHYSGQSTDALRWLTEGVTKDPQNQRIWLTLGYVNSQLGNVEQARTALTNATRIGTDEGIRQSATKMLDSLP